MESGSNNYTTLPTVASMYDKSAETCTEISLVSYNMHGFNQGFQTVRDLICDCKPDIFMLQER